MERRTFLHAGTFSLLGARLAAPRFGLFTSSGSDVRKWFAEVVSAFQARQSSLTFVQPAGLALAVRENDTLLAARDFLRKSVRVYLCQQNNVCFFPLVRRQASAGLTEWLVPFFVRQPDGSWKRLATFNAYQLEALSHAAAELTGRELSPVEHLLPAGAVAIAGNTYHSPKGSVSISTRLGLHGAQSVVAVKAGKTLLFESTLDSRYLFRSADQA